MNKKTINSINLFKGIAAIIIVFTHINGITNLIIKQIANLGYIAVSIFFSISGSLLIEKFFTIEKYENKFISKKIKRIYIPYVLSNIFYITTLILFKNYNISFIKIIKDILGINIVNGITWYIPDLLIIYITFFLLYKFETKRNLIENKYLKYLLLSIYSYLILITLKLNNEHFTFIIFNNLSLSLFMGMAVKIIKFKNPNFFKSNINKYLLILLITLLHFIQNPNNEILNILISQILIPIAIAFLIHYNFNCKNITIEKVLTKIANYSLEIYLIHMPILIIYRNNIIYINNQFIYTSVYIVTLIIFVYLFKNIIKKITNYTLK